LGEKRAVYDERPRVDLSKYRKSDSLVTEGLEKKKSQRAEERPEKKKNSGEALRVW